MTWHSKGVQISILPWRDWDHLEALAVEDGGIDADQLLFFKSLPTGLHLLTPKDLATWINRCCTYPVVQTRHGNFQVRYDLHIWLGSFQLAYNPDLELLIKKRHGFFGRLFSPVLSTPWQRK